MRESNADGAYGSTAFRITPPVHFLLSIFWHIPRDLLCHESFMHYGQIREQDVCVRSQGDTHFIVFPLFSIPFFLHAAFGGA